MQINLLNYNSKYTRHFPCRDLFINIIEILHFCNFIILLFNIINLIFQFPQKIPF